MPVGARWWNQGRNAINQLQRREVQLAHLDAALVTSMSAAMEASGHT